MSDIILQTRELTKDFKGFTAVDRVDLAVQRGHIHALIGPNGAGKTTCFNLLTKFLAPSHGTIHFNGHDITAEKPAQIARRGVIRSFQISAVFPHLSVLENVRIGLQRFTGTSFHFWKGLSGLRALDARVLELLELVDLREMAPLKAADLPYGRKRALEIATPMAPVVASMSPEMSPSTTIAIGPSRGTALVMAMLARPSSICALRSSAKVRNGCRASSAERVMKSHTANTRFASIERAATTARAGAK